MVDYPETTWDEILMTIVLRTTYILNPEAPNSILEEPIEIIKVLYEWCLWQDSVDMYNRMFTNLRLF